MRRFRAKLVGFGLAALAGSAHAADDGWRAAGEPATPPATVVPAGGAPAVLPPSVRFGASSAGFNPDEPLWFPARSQPSPQMPEVIPAQFPEAIPPRPLTTKRFLRRATLQPITWPVRGPRVGTLPQSPTDIAPPRVLPDPATLPTQPTIPAPPPRELPRPPDAPVQPPPMLQPIPPSIPPAIPPANGGYLPEIPRSDRPVTPPTPATSEKECPVAPPALMIPPEAVTPGKHGTFGSTPMRLSRDYSTLADLHGDPVRPWRAFGRGARPGLEGGFVQAEYLLWWMNSLDIPILGTTNTQGGFGFLDEPGTAPIIGPGEFIDSYRQGFRIRAGLWLDECGSCGIDGSFFFLGRRSREVIATSEVFPIITRPIFSPNQQGGIIIGQTGEAVTVPGILTGSLGVEADSFLWGFDANLRKCLRSCCDRRLMWFAGYRNVNLSESLSITENINVIGDGAGRVLITDPVGSVVVVNDRFETRNYFHGGQLGLTYERRWGRLSLDARASIALGVTHQELDISGFQVRTRPGMPPMSFNGGLLAAGPNLGSFSNNEFSVLPEFTLNAGVWVTPRLKVYAGYNLLYWTNVIRPGDEIDPVVDITFVPNAPPVPPSGLNRPAPRFDQNDLWVHGLQFGAEWRW